MANKYYNPDTGRVNFPAVEKDLGYELDEFEQEFTIYWFESGHHSLPKFDSEEAMEFRLTCEG